MIRLFAAASLIGAAWLSTNSTGRAADDYKLGPDSMEQPGVPKGYMGKVEEANGKHRHRSDYWVYVPAQYDQNGNLMMVFQDGKSYVDPNGQFRVPIVFDS